MKRLFAILLSLSIFVSASAQSYDSRFVETYTQYIPMCAAVGMGLFGPSAEHDFLDRGIEGLLGSACAICIVNGVLKNVVKEERPDGRSFNSFPSGHTVTAFLGAELVRKEYGWEWGTVAYTVATSVGVMRVYHERHWWWDALAGAGIGVLCANVGCWLLEPTKNLLGLNNQKFALTTSVDSVSGALCAGVRINLE